MFTAKDVMALRELTQAGMMDCKKALTECEGDFEKAKDYLREKGLATAAKSRSRRSTHSGFHDGRGACRRLDRQGRTLRRSAGPRFPASGNRPAPRRPGRRRGR